MCNFIHKNFKDAISTAASHLFRKSELIESQTWQSVKTVGEPGMKMWEVLNYYFQVLMGNYPIYEMMEHIKPNLPWADIHFNERVGGLPLNPGESYKLWPFYKRDKDMRNEGEQFSHTYMERFWPKKAGNYNDVCPACPNYKTLSGIRYEYGDLQDVVNLLKNDPTTRQAFLPVWFPEDTGATHGKRVPCTIGYHFTIRNNKINITYYIRSCDFLRHFRDDIYLAVCLVDWVRQLVNTNLELGTYTMHIGNLHIFEYEKPILKKHINNGSL